MKSEILGVVLATLAVSMPLEASAVKTGGQSSAYSGNAYSVQGPINVGQAFSTGDGLYGALSYERLRNRIPNASSTAAFYYNQGVKAFEAGKYDKAERDFKATLRADGLDKQAMWYLAKIKEQQGAMDEARRYALAVHKAK